jgi:hypothetical protein
MFTLAMAYLKQADDGAVVALIEPDTGAQIADLLFAAQVPIACQHQPGEPSTWRYSEPNVQKWMRTFARYLSGDSSSGTGRTEVALHQIWPLAGERRTKLVHGVAVALMFGLTFGMVGALVGALVGGLAVGLVVGLMFGLMSGITTPVPELVVFKTSRKGALQARLTVGLTFGLTFGLVGWLVGRLTFGPAVGLTLGPAVGLAGGLTFGLTSVPRRFWPPREGKREIRDDLFAGLMFGLAFGLAFGLSGVLAVGLVSGLVSGLVTGLALGLLIASATYRYACATLIFRRTGIFAARPVKFLEWAVDAGLLRITGTAYQFRHETYREWLTTHPAPAVD